MRKLESRARICLLLAAVLFLGIVVFAWRFVTRGGDWASFYGNQQVYSNGEINRGTIYDRNGVQLLECTTDGFVYPDSAELRKATVAVVGDPQGNVSTGAINMWKSELIGYDLLNGTYDTTSTGKKITMTIDSKANETAYEALGSRQGTVGVFNYKTGDIMCLVNTPSFDPSGTLPSDPNSSVYFNTFLMGALTPGSTFKTVTSAAAIEHDSEINSFTYHCTGSTTVDGSVITCTEPHGTVDFASALAKSCNCAFGQITRDVGAANMKSTVKELGLTSSLDVNGIKTQKGSFRFASNDDVSLSWAGIGQDQDLVNPCSMMVYMGSIANGGEAVQPSLISSSNIIKKITGGKSLGNYLDSDTASTLKTMMKNNVQTTYGESTFEGLDIYAKSGTAEVGTSNADSWFVGFIDDADHPYAFVVWVKGGGTGYLTAGPVARSVLNTLVANN